MASGSQFTECHRHLELECPALGPFPVLAAAGFCPRRCLPDRFVDRAGVGSGFQSFFMYHELTFGRWFRWWLSLGLSLYPMFDLLRRLPYPLDVDPSHRWKHLTALDPPTCADCFVVLLADRGRSKARMGGDHACPLVDDVVTQAEPLTTGQLLVRQDGSADPPVLALRYPEPASCPQSVRQVSANLLRCFQWLHHGLVPPLDAQCEWTHSARVVPPPSIARSGNAGTSRRLACVEDSAKV